MGVRGLQTFLEKYCTEACYWVDIAELTKDYKRISGYREATIVVDADSCYNLWYEGIDWLAGFEIQEYIHRLITFIQCFTKLGVRLVFFFGGPVPEKKRGTWVGRRRQNLKSMYSLFDAIDEGSLTAGHTPNGRNAVLPETGIDTAFILKNVLDCEVYMSTKECDEEIIEYALKHDCFAIFGQDTDFVVSQVEATVLSSNHFKMSNMTTRLYDRNKLAERLRIRRDELPLLSILAGNDLIPFSKISNFHRQLCNVNPYYSRSVPFQKLMPALARYISGLPRNRSIDEILQRISEDLFGDSSQLDVIKTSYYSYFVPETSTEVLQEDEWFKILELAKVPHKNLMKPSVLYSVLTHQLYEECVTFEDLRIIHNGNLASRDHPSSVVTRPLRLRLYGILLREKCHQPVTVTEWCGENIDSFVEPTVVEPQEPLVDHPGLMALWNSDGEGHDMIDTQWRLFLNAVWPTLDASDGYWKSLEDELLLPTLSVFYLYKMKYLEESEMDAVLVTIALYPLYGRRELSLLSYSKLNLRAIRISLTLTRTFGMILTLLAACGYPVPLSKDNAFLKFEGKLFQKKYISSVESKEEFYLLCDKSESSMRRFFKMREFILKHKTEASDTSFTQ